MSGTMERPWSVACVAGGYVFDDDGKPVSRESRIRDQLADLCDTYLPVVTRLVRPARLRVAVERQEPMLPGYLFVDLRSVREFALVVNEPGFLYFIGHDGVPSRMSEADLDKVREVEAEGEMRPQGKPLSLFVDGDVVRVREGPFGDMRAEVTVDRHGQIELDGYDFPRRVKWTDLTNLEKCA